MDEPVQTFRRTPIVFVDELSQEQEATVPVYQIHWPWKVRIRIPEEWVRAQQMNPNG